MGILSNFKEIEQRRIDSLFDIIDRFTGDEITYILVEVFETYQKHGLIAVSIIQSLQQKIAKLCSMPHDAYRDTARFLAAFRLLDDSTKRCLLVTICNDVCKLSVMEEPALYAFLQDRLRNTPTTGGDIKPVNSNNNNKGQIK